MARLVERLHVEWLAARPLARATASHADRTPRDSRRGAPQNGAAGFRAVRSRRTRDGGTERPIPCPACGLEGARRRLDGTNRPPPSGVAGRCERTAALDSAAASGILEVRHREDSPHCGSGGTADAL